MKTLKILILILLFIPARTFAGEIYGTIVKDKAPLANQEIWITDLKGGVVKSTTDANGYFSVIVPWLGRCTLKLTATDFQNASIDVTSNSSPTGYNFSLTNDDGKWQLKKQ